MLDDAHFAAIADAAPFPMWRADCTGRCTLLNRAWVDLTGQPASEGQGDGGLANRPTTCPLLTIGAIHDRCDYLYQVLKPYLILPKVKGISCAQDPPS